MKAQTENRAVFLAVLWGGVTDDAPLIGECWGLTPGEAANCVAKEIAETDLEEMDGFTIEIRRETNPAVIAELLED